MDILLASTAAASSTIAALPSTTATLPSIGATLPSAGVILSSSGATPICWPNLAKGSKEESEAADQSKET